MFYYSIMRACLSFKNLVAGLVLMSHAGIASADVPVRELMRDVERLMDLQDALHRERVDWETQQAALEQELALLEMERDQLQQRIAEHRDVADVDTEAAVERERKRAAQDKALQDALALLETKAALWQNAESVFPEAFPARSGDRLTERLSRLFAATLDIQQQHRSIRIETRILTPDGEGPRQFEILHLGHAQAYAVSRNNDAAGHGVWTGTDWHWTWDRSWASAIREAIRIHQSERAPAWVNLPVTIVEDAP